MSKRFVLVAIFASMAGPVYAADAGGGRPDSPLVEQRTREAIALAGLAPQGPILSSAEGAAGGGPGTIVVDALYGGIVGAVIGLAVGLIEGGNYGRDIGIGAGAGVLVGAVLGATSAMSDRAGPYPASDGLASPDRDPVIQAHTLALAARF